MEIVATATAATAATTAASAVAISTRQHCEGNLIEIAFAKRLGDELLLSINKINLKQLFFIVCFHFCLDLLTAAGAADTSKLMCNYLCVCEGVCVGVSMRVSMCVHYFYCVYAYEAEMQFPWQTEKKHFSITNTKLHACHTHPTHTPVHTHTLTHLLCWQIKLSLHFIIAF